MALDAGVAADLVGRVWEHDAGPALVDYVRIPNVSPAFDPEWQAHGHMGDAIELLGRWCEARPIAGATVEVRQLPGRTPLLLVEVPPTAGAAAGGTVVLYGHLDKQPEMDGWRPGLGPWQPVLEGDRLYGRGSADDGYATFAALSAIEAAEASGGEHGRCLVLIEASEESGSPDLTAHLDALGDRLGVLDLVICLDSSSPTYDRLWLTTSLRGILQVDLRVDLLTEGLHSGIFGGAVPSTFRIARQLLARLEDAETGRILLPELWAEVPAERETQIAAAAAELGVEVVGRVPYVGGARGMSDVAAALLRAATWEPTLEVIAAGGLPPMGAGGNVLRPSTSLSLSFRLPPTVAADAAHRAVEHALTSDVPYGAQVTLDMHVEPGWDAPATAPWLADALEAASGQVFGQGHGAVGLGGSIPFMAMLGARFPDAQFVVTGVIGPDGNAHGPNEYLHLPTARRVSLVVAHLLDAHARTGSGRARALH